MIYLRPGAVALSVVIAVHLLAAAAFAGDLAPGSQAQVSNTGGWGLRLREGPGTNYPILITMGEGQAVDVLEGPTTDPDGIAWYRIAVGDLTGWSAADYLAPSTSPVDVRGIRAAGHAQVSNTGGSGLRIRSLPGTDQAVLAIMPEGQDVAVVGGPALGSSGILWYQVQWNGATGWSMALYLARSSPLPKTAPTPNAVGTAPPASPDLGQRIVAVAKQYLGSPYRFGGNSPETGFDCSGLVQFVVSQVGIPVGRDVTAQYQSGTEVQLDQLVPGDLVFFQNTYIPGLSHVGIYTGDGKFIHANDETTGVIESLLQDEYWAQRWYGARRLP